MGQPSKNVLLSAILWLGCEVLLASQGLFKVLQSAGELVGLGALGRLGGQDLSLSVLFLQYVPEHLRPLAAQAHFHHIPLVKTSHKTAPRG